MPEDYMRRNIEAGLRKSVGLEKAAARYFYTRKHVVVAPGEDKVRNLLEIRTGGKLEELAVDLLVNKTSHGQPTPTYLLCDAKGTDIEHATDQLYFAASKIAKLNQDIRSGSKSVVYYAIGPDGAPTIFKLVEVRNLEFVIVQPLEARGRGKWTDLKGGFYAQYVDDPIWLLYDDLKRPKKISLASPATEAQIGVLFLSPLG
jgi:hypothetical protein